MQQRTLESESYSRVLNFVVDLHRKFQKIPQTICKYHTNRNFINKNKIYHKNCTTKIVPQILYHKTPQNPTKHHKQSSNTTQIEILLIEIKYTTNIVPQILYHKNCTTKIVPQILYHKNHKTSQNSTKHHKVLKNTR